MPEARADPLWAPLILSTFAEAPDPPFKLIDIVDSSFLCKKLTLRVSDKAVTLMAPRVLAELGKGQSPGHQTERRPSGACGGTAVSTQPQEGRDHLQK